MKVPAPAVFEEEWLHLWNAAWEAFPEPDVEGLPDDTADAVLDTNIGKVHEYIHQHMSPLMREFDEYYNGRFADEGELYDKDGLSFVMVENGYPVQDWRISPDRHIVDRHGKPLCYSDGEPIMAKQMSTQLFEFLKANWDVFEDATEDMRWY